MEFDYKDLRIKILQGFGEIGGNCIVLDYKGESIVFDQGIRFSRFRKYYSANVQPSGPSEMRKLKIIPDVRGYTTFFISHFHLDHMGLLQPLDMSSTIYVPNKKVFEAYIGHYEATSNWTTYIYPRSMDNVKDVNDNQHNVVPIEVTHSAYPAVALYYDSGDVRVLYSGDMRVDSPLKNIDEGYYRRIHGRTLLEEYEEKGYDTDVLIIEGTNFSSPSSPMSSHEFIDQFLAILKNHRNSLVLVSVDPIDLESILSILSLAKDRTFVVSGNRLVNMMSFWREYLNLNVKLYQLAYQTRSTLSSTEDKGKFAPILLDEIKKDPQNYVILTEKGVYLEVLREIELDSTPVLISMSTEAKGEDWEDESVEDTWLKALGFIVYRLRISGHYYPYDLKYILETVRPRKIIPIHTEAPRTMCEYARKLGYECLLPGP